MTVSISLPALYRQPIRVSPPGALYCPERRLLHWTLPGSSLTPGTLEVMAAVFRVRGSEAECAQAALDGLVASVDMLGHPGVYMLRPVRPVSTACTVHCTPLDDPSISCCCRYCMPQ